LGKDARGTLLTMTATQIYPVSDFDIDSIRAVLGEPARVQYECAHVYPLCAPNWEAVQTERPRISDSQPGKLYLHIPFCNYACRFCFYYKVIGSENDQKEKYVEYLQKEIMRHCPAEMVVEQVYVGGGTPTALPAPSFKNLLSFLKDHVRFTTNYSFTVECSPESLTPAHVGAMREAGVNRVSIGVDSLDIEILQLINRRHLPAEAETAVKLLNDSEFTVNADLIYGFPNQTFEGFEHDLQVLSEWGVDSLTLYNLRLNEATPLVRSLSDSDRFSLERLIAWRQIARDAAIKHGYKQNRGHTFVRGKGERSTHVRAACVDGFGEGNQIGFGPSAVSHIGYMVYKNVENLARYITSMEQGKNPVDGVFRLTDSDRRTLFVVRTLGETRALVLATYQSLFGSRFEDDFRQQYESMISSGLVRQDEDTLTLTEQGRLVYDLVIARFFPSTVQEWLNERQTVIR
jgi:oxygen-independent coproporphyrinogen III oxidase